MNDADQRRSQGKTPLSALTFRRLTVLRPAGRLLDSCFSDMAMTFSIPSSFIKFRNISVTYHHNYYKYHQCLGPPTFEQGCKLEIENLTSESNNLLRFHSNLSS